MGGYTERGRDSAECTEESEGTAEYSEEEIDCEKTGCIEELDGDCSGQERMEGFSCVIVTNRDRPV